MKILVSSKALAKKLSEINFDNDDVHNVVLNPDKRVVGAFTSCEMSINTRTQSVKIMVEAVVFKAAVVQDNRRWDCIKDLVSMVADQPIVLHITENCTNVIFQY